jgi:hypothetical protein
MKPPRFIFTLVFTAAALLPPLAAQPVNQGIDLGGALIPQPASGTFGARAAGEFVHTVAVSAHLGRISTNYVQRFAELEPLIRDLGIRHIRTDSVIHPQAVANVQRLAAAGIGFTMIAHPDGWGVPDGEAARGLAPDLLVQDTSNPAFIPAFLQHLKASFPQGIEIIEGLNEPDHNIEYARRWMAELRRLGRADPAFAKVQFLGSAYSHVRVIAAKGGDRTDVADLANLHGYPGGRAPEISLPEYLEALRLQYRDLPIHITETGYHNALHNPPNRHRPVSREVDAIYVPRLYLEHFRLGIARSYDYQLLDDRTEEEVRTKYRGQPVQETQFGIIDYTLKPKPVYHAIKNLIGILRDDGKAPGTTLQLAYSIKGPTELRHVLLQKSNGALYLAVWRAVTIWDPVARQNVPFENAAVRVEFDQLFSSVRIYRPTQSGDVIETIHRARTVPLQLGADVLILELRSQ